MDARIRWTGVAFVVFCGVVNAQSPPVPVSRQEPGKLVGELSRLMHEQLARGVPNDLVFEMQDNWGHQAQVPSIQGLTPIHVLRNHGSWQKAKVTVRDVPARASVYTDRISSLAEDRIHFTVCLVLPARAELDRQIWQNGVQVFGEQIHSRFELSAQFEMEAELVPANGGGKMVRLALVSGTYASDHFVAEKVSGLGGELARWLDGGAGRGFKPWQPAVLDAFQKPLADIMAKAGESAAVRSAVAALTAHANGARAGLMEAQTQGTAFAPENVDAAPLPIQVPVAAPVCVGGHLEIDVAGSFRAAAPHVHQIVHPALTHAAIHVAHAAIAAVLSAHHEHK